MTDSYPDPLLYGDNEYVRQWQATDFRHGDVVSYSAGSDLGIDGVAVSLVKTVNAETLTLNDPWSTELEFHLVWSRIRDGAATTNPETGRNARV